MNQCKFVSDQRREEVLKLVAVLTVGLVNNEIYAGRAPVCANNLEGCLFLRSWFADVIEMGVCRSHELWVDTLKEKGAAKDKVSEALDEDWAGLFWDCPGDVDSAVDVYCNKIRDLPGITAGEHAREIIDLVHRAMVGYFYGLMDGEIPPEETDLRQRLMNTAYVNTEIAQDELEEWQENVGDGDDKTAAPIAETQAPAERTGGGKRRYSKINGDITQQKITAYFRRNSVKGYGLTTIKKLYSGEIAAASKRGANFPGTDADPHRVIAWMENIVIKEKGKIDGEKQIQYNEFIEEHNQLFK